MERPKRPEKNKAEFDYTPLTVDYDTFTQPTDLESPRNIQNFMNFDSTQEMEDPILPAKRRKQKKKS